MGFLIIKHYCHAAPVIVAAHHVRIGNFFHQIYTTVQHSKLVTNRVLACKIIRPSQAHTHSHSNIGAHRPSINCSTARMPMDAFCCKFHLYPSHSKRTRQTDGSKINHTSEVAQKKKNK